MRDGILRLMESSKARFRDFEIERSDLEWRDFEIGGISEIYPKKNLYFLSEFSQCSGYHVRLTRARSAVRSRAETKYVFSFLTILTTLINLSD